MPSQTAAPMEEDRPSETVSSLPLPWLLILAQRMKTRA